MTTDLSSRYKLKFELKCPRCGEMWSRLYRTGVCIDCANGKVVEYTKPEEIIIKPKPEPDEVVGENDAIDVQGDLGYGK